MRGGDHGGGGGADRHANARAKKARTQTVGRWRRGGTRFQSHEAGPRSPDDQDVQPAQVLTAGTRNVLPLWVDCVPLGEHMSQTVLLRRFTESVCLQIAKAPTAPQKSDRSLDVRGQLEDRAQNTVASDPAVRLSHLGL